MDAREISGHGLKVEIPRATDLLVAGNPLLGSDACWVCNGMSARIVWKALELSSRLFGNLMGD